MTGDKFTELARKIIEQMEKRQDYRPYEGAWWLFYRNRPMHALTATEIEDAQKRGAIPKMNYEPNTVVWKPNDLVLHDADAKAPYMLMKVIGYTKNNECITIYHAPPRWMDRRSAHKRYVNEIKYLLDPKKFGIDAERFRNADRSELDRTWDV